MTLGSGLQIIVIQTEKRTNFQTSIGVETFTDYFFAETKDTVFRNPIPLSYGFKEVALNRVSFTDFFYTYNFSCSYTSTSESQKWEHCTVHVARFEADFHYLYST